MNVSFTLHTELRASVPEFTISCLTHGGPASIVGWTVDGVKVNIDHETSQVILDTSLNSVYDNRLRVRGRRTGTYYCIIIASFNKSHALAESSETIAGIIIPYLDSSISTIITAAGEPTTLKANISNSTCTHVNVPVSWESPGGDVSGYMIYYQTEGGPVISDKVSGEVEQSCTDNSAVIAGGVGGVMTLIIVSQSVIILILLLRQKKATNSQKRFVTLVLDDFLLTACSHYTQSLLR